MAAHIDAQQSHSVTLCCGCTVYVSCHPITHEAHTRVIERRGVRCWERFHHVGARLRPSEMGVQEPVAVRANADRRVEDMIMDGNPARPRDNARLADEYDEALRRARADYLEMPGLKLTAAQAARFWCFDSSLCTRVLEQLVESRFLTKTGDAAFARR